MKKSECEYREMCDLSASSSAKLPSLAKVAIYPDNENVFLNTISLLNECGIPYVVLGGMSNVIIKNHLYDGIVVKTDKIRTKTLAESKIALGCGLRMSGIIRYMSTFGFGGMEGLYGIPGTVGGMLKQNAGAYGYEISDRFVSATCYVPDIAKTVSYSKDDMCFSYRNSILSANGAVLISATFDFVPKSCDEIVAQIRNFRTQRLQSQPLEYPSLGSIFKRHNGVSAGFYIDQAGLKGFSIGGAEVSTKHAGFIVNKGGAVADDYLKVIDYVKRRVDALFGIELEEEINII